MPSYRGDWRSCIRMEKTGFVVSDLHLFAPRSDGARLFAKKESDLASVDALVLNGDTFDFRWSEHPSEAATIEAALSWLRGLMDRHPDLLIHFVLGNHDCLIEFRREMEELAELCPNLSLHEHRVLLGSHLFLHGDCANWPMDEGGFRKFRASWSRHRLDPERKRLCSVAYRWSDSLGLSRRFHDCYFPDWLTLDRVVYHLDQMIPGWEGQITHCYFGHTHRPFQGQERKGVQFANTGSGIRKMGFQPLTFSWAEEPRSSPLHSIFS